MGIWKDHSFERQLWIEKRLSQFTWFFLQDLKMIARWNYHSKTVPIKIPSGIGLRHSNRDDTTSQDVIDYSEELT